MSVLESTGDHLKATTRRILVLGCSGTGKTTLSISASAHAGLVLPSAKRVLCSDVVLLSGDNEGVAGAVDANLEPRAVVDFTVCKDWVDYQRLLTQALNELRPLVAAKEVKYIVIDLALPERLIREQVNPDSSREWTAVAVQGSKLFSALGALKGATIIGNAQLKSAAVLNEYSTGKHGADQGAIAAADAKAVGGQRSTFTNDLVKGVGKIWVECSSFMLAREVRRIKDPMRKDAPIIRKFYTHTQSNPRFEAKCRFASKLLPTEPGERTLHSLLVQAYGDSL